MRLRDKVIIITGGTDGIGLAAAEIFAAEGAKVTIAARNDERGQEVAERLSTSGQKVRFLKTDVASADSVRRLVETTFEEYGRLDVLYNNAAVFWPAEDVQISELEEDIWDKVIAINLTGTFLCTKYAVLAMQRSGGGSIISTSSTGGTLGLGNTAYGASKAGVVSLMKNVATQYGADNIRANTIVPGITETPMVEALFADPDIRRQWIDATPVGKFGRPADVAMLALFLASDESAYVSGAEYLIDGGFSAK
ncbi:MAG: SDR family NAD(P)-dependent oxidoreductase [Pseudomonadales bacterium]